MSDNTLLISDTMIKERTAIHGNIDPKLIYPDIKFCQDLYILPILGTALFDKLLTNISGGTTGDAAFAEYKILIDRYIVDALMYFTLSELPTTISYQFWNKGVVRKQGESTEMPSMSELLTLSEHYKKRAELYAQKLMMYLKQNAHTKFPEYLNPGSTMDTITPEQRAFTMPIYLGDGNNPYCNDGGFNGQPYSE